MCCVNNQTFKVFAVCFPSSMQPESGILNDNHSVDATFSSNTVLTMLRGREDDISRTTARLKGIPIEIVFSIVSPQIDLSSFILGLRRRVLK